jgi:hypothetical protein
LPILHPDPPRIPPHLASEREVLAALKTLPPEAHVFVRLAILDPETNRDRELDFLVLHPELGIIIVEVKGHGVEPRGDHWVRNHPDGTQQRLDEAPGEQLTQQQYLLLHFLKAAGVGFVPQITRVLALPSLPLRAGQSLGPDLPACRILTRDKLRQPFLALREAVTAGRPWEHWQALPQASHYHIQRDTFQALLKALTPLQLPPPSLAELMEEEGEVQDREAQFLLDHLSHNFSQGRYHVYGAPGSGKSLLGRKVTRLWAAEGRKVLVVAFNKALTYATQSAMDDLIRSRQAVVSTYHDLAVTLLDDAQALPPFTTQAAFFNTDLPAAMKQANAAIRERWDALVVDEAQDLEPEWVEQLQGLLRDPQRDPILVLEDPAQSLYRETQHGLGQPWRLELSLRQNAAIRRAAILALPSCGWALPPETGDAEGAVTLQPSSPATWKKDLAAVLEGFGKDGLEASQVLILAPHRPQTLGIRDGETLGPWTVNAVSDWWEGDKAGHVRFGTVQGFKGLEADAVVYLAPAYRHKDAGRLRYTALSRARHRVVVLEKALAEPVRPPDAPAPVAAPAVAMPRQVRTLNPGHQQALLGALRSVQAWKA